MPTYEVFVDNKPRKIELTKTNEKTFAVKIDGKTLDVKLPTDKPDFKEFSLEIDDKVYQVRMPGIDTEKPFQVKVEEVAFKAEVKIYTTKTVSTAFESIPFTPMRKAVTIRQVVEGGVTAPMTGKIISVKVKKGDQVETGQVLCVIEAMKMENEITSPKGGTVQEVNVTEGSSVSEDEILFIIG